MPRKYLGTDNIMRENTLAIFDDAYPIEAYVANVDGFQGSGDLMTKFGIRVTDETTFIISRERFEDYVSDLMSNAEASEGHRKGTTVVGPPDRPMEGDLVYFPLTDSLFEIKFVEHENPFYQLGKLYTYELRCELFEYEQEVIDTDIEDIDNNAADIGYVVTLTLAGTGVTATSNSSIRNGSVNQIILENDGYGYSSPPTVSISTSPNGSSVANATAVAITTIGYGSTTYSVQSIQITNVGFGYTQPPTVTIVGDGFGAKARANIGTTGVVIIDSVSGGSGYTVNPNVGVTTSPVGLSSANAVIESIVTDGSVSELRLVNAGFGYVTPPIIKIDTPFKKRESLGVGNVTTSVGSYTTTGIVTSVIGIGTTIVGIATTVGTVGANPTTAITGIDTTGIQLGDALQVGLGISDGTVITGIGSTNAPDVIIVGLAMTVSIGSTIFTITRVESTGIEIVSSFSTSFTKNVTLGELSSISITDPGIGYTVAPTITIGNPSGFSSGIITAVVGLGTTTNSVTSLSIENGGTGYGVTPSITISDPSAFRVGVITVGLSSSGIGTTIGSISIGSSGAFYATVPTLSITGPSSTLGIGSTATAVAFINNAGFITGAVITSPGFGYSTTDILTVSLTGGISTATGTVGINTVGIITTVSVTNAGFGYTVSPTVTLVGGISTATAVSFINSSGIVTSTSVTFVGFGYTTPPTVTFSEPKNPLNTGDYLLNEIVTGQTGLATALVKDWNSVTRTLKIYNVSGNFGVGEIIVGSAGTIGAGTTDHVNGSYIISNVEYDELDTAGTDSFADNKQFQIEADDIVDWTETNPFGTF